MRYALKEFILSALRPDEIEELRPELLAFLCSSDDLNRGPLPDITWPVDPLEPGEIHENYALHTNFLLLYSFFVGFVTKPAALKRIHMLFWILWIKNGHLIGLHNRCLATRNVSMLPDEQTAADMHEQHTGGQLT